MLYSAARKKNVDVEEGVKNTQTQEIENEVEDSEKSN